jgi:biotin operon repressor
MTGTSSRMLALLSLLQTPRDWPGRVLAERLEVTTRTVRRDVERLRELGYRIEAAKGPDGGYRLAAGSELPPLLFDDDQAVALRNVSSSGVDIEEAAVRALATVGQVMPSRLRHRIDALQFTGTASRTRVDPAVLDAVSGAVRGRMTLRFDYGDRGRPPRRAQPHGLLARHGLWYLVAWDLDREDWRIYRLDRMTPRIPTGQSFTPRPVPTGDVGSFLAARSKGSSDENRWPCVGQFEISPSARELAPWNGDGMVEAITDRSSLVTAGSWSWTGLLAHILRLDAPFRILGPQELIAASEGLVQRLNSSQAHSRPSPGAVGNCPPPLESSRT